MHGREHIFTSSIFLEPQQQARRHIFSVFHNLLLSFFWYFYFSVLFCRFAINTLCMSCIAHESLQTFDFFLHCFAHLPGLSSPFSIFLFHAIHNPLLFPLKILHFFSVSFLVPLNISLKLMLLAFIQCRIQSRFSAFIPNWWNPFL